MGKPPLEIPDMPPLTLDMHGELRSMENDLMRALTSCCGHQSLNDPDAAVEYTRTYAIKFYDCFYGFYSQIPDEKYRPHWQSASERSANERVAKCIDNNYLIRSFFNVRERTERIRRTIANHASRNSRYSDLPTPGKPDKYSSLVAKQAASYEAAGIDITSGSPLLMMARTAGRGSKQAVVPNNQRFSASVVSPSAARKMENYISANGIGLTEFATRAGTTDRTLRKFRRTGKVKRGIFEGIAKAMGTTKDALLSD